MKLQESGENYLENILILQKSMDRVRSVDLATAMNFSKPSISRAVHLLEDEKYIRIENDGSLVLTDKGRAIAEMIYERHVFLTEFLLSMGVDEEQAAEDACRMEHVISEKSFQAMKNGFSHCPPNCPRATQQGIFASNNKVLSGSQNKMDESETAEV